MQPEKDLSKFALLGLKYNLLRLEQIVTWADGIIAERDNPPNWAIELAMVCNHEEACSILRWIPGNAEADSAINLVGGLLRRRWISNSLTWHDVTQFVWSLLYGKFANGNDLPFIRFEAGYTLLIAEEEFEQNQISDADMTALVDEILMPYDKYQSLLPTWAV